MKSYSIDSRKPSGTGWSVDIYEDSYDQQPAKLYLTLYDDDSDKLVERAIRFKNLLQTMHDLFIPRP